MPTANIQPHPITLGSTITCAETGKQFVAALTRGGMSFNYALDRNSGRPVSDEGVDIRERRELLDRSRPFMYYLSSDGRHVTGWKGNILGTVDRSSSFRGAWHGAYITAVTVRDIHGQQWHGRGAGRGMCITLRPSKSTR